MKPLPDPDPGPSTRPQLADGTLLQAPGRFFYVVYGQAKFALGRTPQFTALNLDPQNAHFASALLIRELATVPLSGTVLREVSTTQAYVVWGGERLAFADGEAQASWGFGSGAVHIVPDGALVAWPIAGTIPTRTLPPESGFEPPRPELVAVVQSTLPASSASAFVTPDRNGAFSITSNAPFTLRLATSSLRSPRFSVNGAPIVPSPANASVAAFMLSRGSGTVALRAPAGATTDAILRLPGVFATATIDVHNEGGAANPLRVPVVPWSMNEYLVHRISGQNQVFMHPDGQSAAQAIMFACRSAAHSIRIMQLEFPPVFNAFGAAAGPSGYLANTLIERGKAGVDVRILMDPLDFVGKTDQLDAFAQRNNPSNFRIKRAPLYRVWPGSLATSLPPPRDVIHDLVSALDVNLFLWPFGVFAWWKHVDTMLGLQRLHAKLVIIDGSIGFIVGFPFSDDYWDTQSHNLDQPNRGTPQPMHTVTHEFRGPAVADLDDLFAHLWNGSDAIDNAGRDQIAAAPPPAPTADAAQTVQIVRTLPRSVESFDETGVLEVYLRTIRNAKRFL